MKYIGLCPKCSGRLAMTDERVCCDRKPTEVGALTDSAAASNAAESLPVTLKSTRCGYMMETDAETARDAEEFGQIYERFCAHKDLAPIDTPDNFSELYSMEQRNVYKFYGAIHRDEEREKIGLDLHAVKEQVDQIKAECDTQIQEFRSRLELCADQRSDCEQQLSELVFFKLIKRFSLKRKLAGLKKEELALSDQTEACSDSCQEKIDGIVAEIVERCRILAVGYMEKYAPREYMDILYFLYSVLSGKPMTADCISETYQQQLNGMTQQQITAVFNNFTNPFVSKTPMSDGFYFGPEKKASCSFILDRLVEPEQLEPLEHIARDMYGDHFRPYHDN